MKRLKWCEACKQYTMKEQHCGSATKTPHPPKYTPDDKYASYRRQAKKEGIL
ncbi:MAG: nucleolar RNA-binding Nop10p family protein [Nanoarchaeota archaeon]|nr:nucleolar RNA-binding Nop10p family protein [Nanoarchaeota archaeon]